MTAEQDLARYERATNDPNAVRFLAYDLADWRPIGRCSLNDIDHRNHTAEFGVLVGDPADRGKGYGAEMARMMLDYAFTALGLHNVMLRVAAFNVAGMRAYEKAGFREFARRRMAFRSGSRSWDDVYMECLATEFESPWLARILAPDAPR
jgi:diamine N-acetyltransferase